MIRKLTLAFALLLLSLLTMLVLAAVLLDPKDFEVDLAEWITQRTGREVRILGGYEYEFFPWLGIRMKNLRMAQAEGFGEHAFLTVKETRVRVRILPLLLSQTLQFDRIEITSPMLRLHRKADGSTNWGDLLDRIEAEIPAQDSANQLPPAEAGKTLTVAPFSWRGVTLEQGTATFTDDSIDERLMLDALELRIGKGLEFDYALSFTLSRDTDAGRAEVAMRGRCLVQTEPFNLLLKDSDMAMAMQTLLPPPEEAVQQRLPLHGGLNGLVNANLAAESVDMKNVRIRLGGMELTGDIGAQNLFHPDYVLQGAIALEQCATGAPPPIGDICSALENVAARSSFTADRDSLELTGLEFVTPGGNVNGQASFEYGETSSIAASLSSDSLDIDALSPESPSEDDATDPEAATTLPFWLSSWPEEYPRLSLALDAGKLEVGALTMEESRINAISAPGELHLELEKAAFLDGTAALACSSKSGAIYCEATLTTVDANDMSDLLFGDQYMQGTLSLEAKASSKGVTSRELWTNARLQADISFRDGALDFTSPPKILRKAQRDGSSPMPNFYYKGWDMILAVSNANAKGDARAMPFAYTLQASFTNLATQGLFGKALPARYGMPRPEFNGDVSGDVSLEGVAVMDITQPMLLRIDRSEASLDYQGPGTSLWPTRRWHFTGTTKALLDLDKDMLAFTNINGSLPGLQVGGELIITDVFYPGPPTRYSGRIDLPQFVPRSVLPLFDVTVPETEDENTFSTGSLHATYGVDDTRMDIDLEKAVLDKTTAGGSISIQDLDKDIPSLHVVELYADTFNLDAYLPPDETEAAPAKVDPPEQPWDNGWLRHLRLEGSLEVGEFSLYELRHQDLHADIKANKGLLSISPITSGFYGGQFIGQFQARVPEAPTGLGLSNEVSIANFRLEDVAQELGGEDAMGGTANWNMTLAGGGGSWKQLMRSLSGKANFIVKDGFYTFTGKSKTASYNKPETMLGESPAPLQESSAPTRTRTPFSRAEATFIVQNGQVSNDDFLVQGLVFEAEGSGTASLPAKTLDYTILVQMTGAPTIPVRLRGSFDNPDITIWQHQMLTDSVGRLGGSVFNVFKSILTLPFKAMDALQK